MNKYFRQNSIIWIAGLRVQNGRFCIKNCLLLSLPKEDQSTLGAARWRILIKLIPFGAEKLG